MRNKRSALAGLMLGAIGVVFGDIGTSPLYALQAVFGPLGLHLAITPQNVYGIISLIIWAVTLVVSIKYIGFVMRAGNHGEGGILALVALLQNTKLPARRSWPLVLLGLIGVALFYGDSAITPAISVLSAVEGLKAISPGLTDYIVPITLVLLAGLFWVQRYGTGTIGKLFGPIMLVWFTTIGLAGAWQVAATPEALQALSPLAAIGFVAAHPLAAFVALGAVVLAITGAEALYADMGHFGRRPIARAWFLLVFPALLLCYMGQGAVILSQPLDGSTPFMALFPTLLQLPAVLLATAATLIASQSVISGAFSLTRQAVQLNFLPRMRVLHTSDRETGQVYLPLVNLLLAITVTALVIGFGSSERLAHAYGIAVSGTLAIDTILFLAVARLVWRKPALLIAGGALLFLIADILFVAANAGKILQGGWFPLAISLLLLAVIISWLRGQRIIARERRNKEGTLQDFIDTLRRRSPPLVRVPGTAVYIGHHAGLAPLALHAAVEKLHELHERVIIITVRLRPVAHVAEEHRAEFDPLNNHTDGISHLVLSYGYHDSPNVPRTLLAVRKLDPELDFDPAEVSYFVSLSKAVRTRRHNLPGWQKSLYLLMNRNQLSSSDYYKLPPERTIEMRSLVEL